ncbi:TetR/AcrR family transcriptional regulator [Kutzneria kofuensis]|uniref:AcrR family transcriptional regulator n=1 Tax=Kutzneria kofuensis TaxID=103725 RepID=A0A7W9NJ15_9PSEU|nr:TetR/AcrR family transcriptional regulator [Kutzneria kofuensis]MBB5895192.1 AcrR family transcriptional regulator [Kutzneria kofuensis]
MERKDPKRALLDKAVDHLSEHGVIGRSLRQLAAELGTSHRMLIYHFGSMEGLLVEVVREVEARQRAVLADLDGAGSPVDLAKAFWRRFTDPALYPNERLFFELYGQALQGRPGTEALLPEVVTAWIEPLVAIGKSHGLSEQDARVHARLGVAVTRGLLLDLLATGDLAAVNAAMDRFVDMYVVGLP